jgi:hypothetical protein
MVSRLVRKYVTEADPIRLLEICSFCSIYLGYIATYSLLADILSLVSFAIWRGTHSTRPKNRN